MLTGTISDYDTHGKVGVIDTDDGRLLIFSLDGVEPRMRKRIKIGRRVKFDEQPTPVAMRAVHIAPVHTSRPH